MLARFKTLIIAGALVLALCLLWFFLLYRPQVSKMRLLRQESQNLILKLQSLHVSDEQITGLEARIASLKKEIARTQTQLIPKDDLPAAVSQIRRRGQAYGIKFEQVIPDYETLIALPDETDEKTEVLRLTVHMKMQGRYKNFGNFLNSFTSLPFFVSVDEVRMLFNQEIHPELEIMLDAVLYLRNDTPIKTRT